MPRCATTGKVTRARYTSLKLGELSSVDRPAQIGALATIMKRHDGPAPVIKAAPSILALAVAKYVDDEDGAHTFAEVLEANEFDEKIWPMTSALSQSIRSIMGDKDIKREDKETKVTQSVDEFLAAVRDLSPTAEKQLAQAISSKKEKSTMKTVAELIAENPALKAHIDDLTGQIEIGKAEAQKAKDAEAKLKTEEEEHGKTKKALAEATDEVIKVGETEIKKSAVGEQSFVIFKAQEERALTAELAKRAQDEFAHVVGTPTEKALVLKAATTMDEPTAKALTAILTSAEKMAAAGFDRLGGGAGPTEDVAKAQTTFKAKVAEIVKRDGITEVQAMSKARTEFPEEYAAAYAPAEA